jgi:acyl-CoA synthetase (NDP forming)
MSDLEFLFHPQSIAIVGTPSDPTDVQGAGVFLDALISFGYRGDIYPVNPRASEIMSLKTYPDLMSVPKSPDYVICCLPASLTPQLMKDCAARGVKAISMYTAGFSEESEEGRKLEQELVSLARQGGVRLIGPNCMGIYCPGTGLSYNPGLSKEAGRVGFLCQSGGNSLALAFMADFRSVRFSKVISYGNAADLNEADFLEYLAQDAETEIIAAYVEGVKEGRRFTKNLTQAAKTKPVIILKGGHTEAGAEAAASHTGALRSSKEIWDAFCRQTGVVQAYSLEEMLDIIETFLYLKPLKGRRVAILGWGGGASVTSADDCEGAGISVPAFSSGLRQQLKRFVFGVGSSATNPVDSSVLTNPSLLSETIRMIGNSKEVDVLLVHMPLAEARSLYRPGMRKVTIETIVETGKSIDIPIAIAQLHGDTPESSGLFFDLQQRCLEAGFPLYSTTRRAAQAINKFIEYHVWKNAHMGRQSKRVNPHP